MITTTCKSNIIAQDILRFIAGVTLLFACSQLVIPLNPVPISLQTVGVMMIALLYSMREGLQVITGYIIAGALGAPVFAGYGTGIHTLLSSTGGYLMGFIACIYCMNKMKLLLNPQTITGMFLNCLVGTAIIFASGITWLALGINLGWKAAIIGGFMPFIIPGFIKMVALTAALKSLNLLSR